MKFRIKDDKDPYAVVSSIIEQMVEEIFKNESHGDLIVRMGIKDDIDTKYDYDNYFLYNDLMGGYGPWKEDWFEGQRCIDLIGFTPVDYVEPKYWIDHIQSHDMNIVVNSFSQSNRFKIAGYIDDILSSFQDEVEYE